MTEAKAETSSTDLGARRRSNWADPMVTPFVLQTLRKVFPAATDGCTTHFEPTRSRTRPVLHCPTPHWANRPHVAQRTVCLGVPFAPRVTLN